MTFNTFFSYITFVCTKTTYRWSIQRIHMSLIRPHTNISLKQLNTNNNIKKLRINEIFIQWETKLKRFQELRRRKPHNEAHDIKYYTKWRLCWSEAIVDIFILELGQNNISIENIPSHGSLKRLSHCLDDPCTRQDAKLYNFKRKTQINRIY